MKVLVKPILFFCSVAMLAACGDKGAGKDNSPMIVKVSRAEMLKGGDAKEFPFIAKPFRTSELSFRVGGPIDCFDVFAGRYYKRGDVIAGIDARDFRVRKERAQALYDQSEAEFGRISVLFEKNNVAASVYEKAQADYRAAKTALETVANELHDTRLTAPFDGYVNQVYIEKFQDVKAAQPVVSFVDITKLRIEVYVTQDIAYGAQNLKEVGLLFDADPGRIYSARIIEVSKGTASNNLSYLLTAELPNEDGKLLAGMSGKVFFDADSFTATPLVSVPLAAVCHRHAVGDYVWIVDPESDKVSCRKVKSSGLRKNGFVAIAEGVSPGERVAVSGLRFLSDGMPVSVLEE